MNKKNTVNVSVSSVFVTWYEFYDETKPNFKYCISLARQNPHIQPGLFLDKMRNCVWNGYPN